MNFSADDLLLLVGYENGEIIFFDKNNNYSNLGYIKCHDQDVGKIIGFGIYNNLLVSGSHNATIASKNIFYNKLITNSNEEGDEKPITLNTDLKNYLKNYKIIVNDVSNIIAADGMYSIQDNKLKSEDDKKYNLAEDIKNKKLSEIKNLRQRYLEFIAKNNSLSSDYKFEEDELVIDTEFRDIIVEKVGKKVIEKQKELKWKEEYSDLTVKKLLDYYFFELELHDSYKNIIKNYRDNDIFEIINNVELCKLNVGMIKEQSFVSSFKLKKLTKYMKNKIEEINEIIDSEKEYQNTSNIKKEDNNKNEDINAVIKDKKKIGI